VSRARGYESRAGTALAIGDAALAGRLADGLEPRYPLDEHALCAARSALAEHAVKLKKQQRFRLVPLVALPFELAPKHVVKLRELGRPVGD
jgi:hypothetical protein